MNACSTVHSRDCASTTPTVFVLDDDSTTTSAIERLTATISVAIQSFHNPVEFVTHVQPEMRGCVIMEYCLPEMDGCEMLAELDRRGCWLPVILAAERADISTAVRALKNGAFDYLEKPFCPELMLDRINEAIQIDVARTANRARLEEVDGKFRALSPEERQVTYLLAAGKSTSDIASVLTEPNAKIEDYKTSVMSKLNVETDIELARLVFTREDLRLRMRGASA